ncbi:MAG: hypothetical protein J6X58_07570 [Bacteroidales bacterium]|nr:hypothetical protein [Bacteroidales bacterium]
MPMFYTPKPRQFKYRPRFYDPEKEEWEKLKAKYRIERGLPLDGSSLAESVTDNTPKEQNVQDGDLDYYRRKVREFDREENQKKQKLTLSDFFRKRERPQFHYVSRFDSNGNVIDTPVSATKDKTVKKRITRRFDNDDMDRFKPMPAGKIMLYTLLVCMLLYFIFT